MRRFLLPAAMMMALTALSACDNVKTTAAAATTCDVPNPCGTTTTVTKITPEFHQEPGNIGDRVFFDLDSSVLSADAQATLGRQAAWLKKYRTVVVIEGHTDERGTREYNLALGARRANAVRNYLIAQGVPADRLTTISYGKERPQILGSDETAWSQNRRAVSVPQNVPPS